MLRTGRRSAPTRGARHSCPTLRPSAWQSHASTCREPKEDSRKGASRRASHAYAFKCRVLRTLHEMQATAKQTTLSFSHRVTINPVSDTADAHGIGKSLVSKWSKPAQPDKIIAADATDAPRTRPRVRRADTSLRMWTNSFSTTQLKELRLKNLANSWTTLAHTHIPFAPQGEVPHFCIALARHAQDAQNEP
jgi:hypothetical protein